MFKDRDSTIVGDRGVTLSGGQKSRISLARAVYTEADIALLDDPLSAVDAEVGNQIFQQCIKQHLGGKTVILATHQLQFLSQADKVLILDSGKALFYGRYNELLEKEALMQRLGGFLSRKGDKIDREHIEHMDYTESSGVLEITSVETTEGNVTHWTCYNYVKFGFRSTTVMILVTLVMLLSHVCGQSQLYWAAYWSKQSDQDSPYYSNVMAYITIATYIVIAIRTFLYLNLLLKSNIKIHNKALGSIAATPAAFFDSNTTGSIISRFSKDIGVIDGPLQQYLTEAYATTLSVIVNLSVTIAVNPYNLVIMPFVILIFFGIYWYVSPLVIQLRKLEIIAKGPLLSTLNSALNGLPTLRCLNLQQKFENDVKTQAINHYRSYLTFHTILRFSQLYLEISTIIIVSVNVIILIATKGYIDPALAAYSMTTTAFVLSGVGNLNKSVVEASTNLASAQRLLEYIDMPNEGCYNTSPALQITRGHIHFKDIYMRYRSNLPYSLSGLNVEIKAGHKIGVVGRTGAGKSSILQVLFRLVEPGVRHYPDRWK